jgi:hypothetical protein
MWFFGNVKFAGIAAASPSMWFPGFVDYMKNNAIQCTNVYLSLGDREENTKTTKALPSTTSGSVIFCRGSIAGKLSTRREVNKLTVCY